MATLDEAVRSLHDIAVTHGKATSTIRLQGLADYCAEELARRGLPNAETEVVIPGGGREKQWDVAWKLHEKYRLAISLKSILRNPAGTVPNRIDDLMGEVANVQMYSPEIVLGYLMVFDVSQDSTSTRHGSTWCQLLRHRLTELSGRKAPSWSVGMIEAFAIVEVNFSRGPVILGGQPEVHQMFDVLAQEVRRRNPAISRDA
jgi:hypothetical protein